MIAPKHVQWLKNTGTTLFLHNGGVAEIWELKNLPDQTILSEWAKHFRNHYCLDDDIDKLRQGTNLSRADYLKKHVFPDQTSTPGPSIRSGDFAEILMADFIEYVLGYWVPRFRYDEKSTPNESTKGVDILGFKSSLNNPSPLDELMICEVKASLSIGNSQNSRLQDAVNDSVSAELRKSYSLNAFIRKKDNRSSIVERFQDPINSPYLEKISAAAVLDENQYDTAILSTTDISSHPKKDNLRLFIMTGPNLMTLVHSLYERAANEA